MAQPNNKPYQRPDRPGWWATVYDEHGKRQRIKVASQDEGYETAVVNRQRAVDRVRMVRDGLVTRRQVEVADAAGNRVARLIEDYGRHLRRLKRSDKHVRNTLRWLNVLARDQRIKTLGDLTPRRVAAWLEGIIDGGSSARTHNAARAAVRQFARWLARKDKLTGDPTVGVMPHNEAMDRREESRPFTLDQADQLMAGVSPERSLFYRFGFRCGLRTSEIRDRPRRRGLRWGDLDLDTGWLFLRASDTKAGRDDELPMTPDLIEAARAFKPDDAEPEDFIFSCAPDRYSWIRDLVRAGLVEMIDPEGDVVRANLRGYEGRWGQFDRKSIRTSFVTHRAWAGVDLVTLTKLARHTDPKLTLNIYTKAMRMIGQPAGVMDLRAAACKGLEDGGSTVSVNGAKGVTQRDAPRHAKPA